MKKKLSLLTALLLYIVAAYPAVDSWVQRSIDGKNFTIYIDAAINHVIKNSKTNIRSGLHWQNLTALDQTRAVKKSLQIGKITFKFNQYLMSTDSRTGVEIHHLALTDLDENHDCIIIDRSTNSAWIKSFFGSKLTNVYDVRTFINELLRVGDVKLDNVDDQELTITIQYKKQSYRAVLRYKNTHNQQDLAQATLITIYPIISCLGNIDRDNVPKNITEQLATSRSKSPTSSPVSGKSTPTSRSANSSPKTPETTVSSRASTPEKELRDIFMSAAGKPDEQGTSHVNAEILLDLWQQDPDLLSSIDTDGNTALHYLAETKDKHSALDIAWIFMDEDIINQYNAHQQTALTIALKNKNYHLAQQILFAGGTSQVQLVAKQAVQAQDLDALRILIDHIDIHTPIQQYTLLGYAVSINNQQLIQFLLQHGADPRALRYKPGASSHSIESCENSEPSEFINKFSHTKQEKEKLIAILTDAQPVTKDEKNARWWRYLHEGKYLSAAKLYEPSWANQRSALTNETALEFACKRQAIPLVQQLLADGADTLAQTTQGLLIINWVKTLASSNQTEKIIAIEQVIDQAFQQQVAAIDACIEKIQSQQMLDSTKFTSDQLQYISPRYRCSIAQALSIAQNSSVIQTVLTQHKIALVPVLTYCLEHTRDWQHSASQQILVALTTKAKETQDKASFDALANFCMCQTDVDQVGAIVQAIATAGANALELKLVEHFVTANPVMAQRLIALLSDRGLTLSHQSRFAGNKMTLAELLVEKNNVQLMSSLAERDKGLDLDLLLMNVADTQMVAVVREHKERRALQSMINKAGHTPLTLAIVRDESTEKINEILTTLPELLNKPSSKAKIYPIIYALQHSESCYRQLRQTKALIPANAVEQALALRCSSLALTRLLAEPDCQLPMDSSTASCLVNIATQEQSLQRTLAQKISDYIELHSSIGNMPEAYTQVIQSFWSNPEHVVAATKFAQAKVAQFKQDEQKAAYLCTIDRTGMIEVLTRMRDKQLIAQVIVQLTQHIKDKPLDTQTIYIIYQLLDLLTLPEIFTLTVKNQSLITVAPVVIDKYLCAQTPTRAAKELSVLGTTPQDTFVSQLSGLSAEADYTICQQLQNNQLTAKVIARRLTTNRPCTILHELITEEVASIEVEKDGSTLAHLLMNYEDTDILLHYCAKFPDFFFKPNKKGIRPIDIAIKKNKEQLITIILTKVGFNIQQLTAHNNGRSLVELRKESKTIAAYIAVAVEQEFSQASSPLQRAVELSTALIPDAVTYMEQQGIEPRLGDYLALHEAQQFEKFDELLEKHVQAGLPPALLIPLARRVNLRDKKYMQKVYHQMIIELSTSKAMNEQVFDMQKASPIVVDTFPFCLVELDEQTLIQELVNNVKYDAPGKLLAEFINALEVVAVFQRVIHQDDREMLDGTDYVLQALYNKCQSYLVNNGIKPSEETFVGQIIKIAQNNAIQFKAHTVTISNRLVMINCLYPMFQHEAELLTSLDHRQIQEFWDKQVLEKWTPAETNQAAVMSFNALSMMLFGLAPVRFHADLQKLIELRMDTSEQIRMSTPFVTLHNTCKYFHAHPHAALQKFPNFEERFVHFCVQVLRNTLSYSCSRILDHTTIELLCDMCLILIDLCPTYGEFILEQVAPTLEPYLAQAKPFYAVLKHPARHCELLVWAMEKRNIAAAKFLVTLSPVVASDKNIYDLDESWATTINPETLEKLHKFNRAITSQQKKFTFGDLFYCMRVPTTENVDRGSGHYRDIPLRSNTPPNIQNLYLANLKDAANQEYLKIKSIISLIKRHPHECTNLKLVPTINYLYKKILNMAGSLKLDIGDNPYNSHFIHRNAVPQLYIYIRTLCVYNNINELLHALTVELEHTTGQHIGNVEAIPDKENQQYYLALALDLDICASIFSAEENDQARELANFCRNFIQMLTLNMGGIETFNEYKSTMTSTINEILTPIFEDSLYLQYIGSIMHSLSEQISSDLQELNQEMQRHIGLIPQ